MPLGSRRSRSGSPADVVLRPVSDRSQVKVIPAVQILMTNGLTMLKAKRAVEAALDHGELAVRLPAVESIGALAQGLRTAGLRATKIATGAVDVRVLRECLGLTQEQFSLRYNLSIDSVQAWEAGRQPDRAASNYLRVIAADPGATAAAQEVEAA